MYKNQSPCYLFESLALQTNSRFTRWSNNIICFHFTRIFFENYFFPSIIEWYNLDISIRNSKSLSNFSTYHYLLHCPNFINERSLLQNTVSTISKNILASCDATLWRYLDAILASCKTSSLRWQLIRLSDKHSYTMHLLTSFYQVKAKHFVTFQILFFMFLFLQYLVIVNLYLVCHIWILQSMDTVKLFVIHFTSAMCKGAKYLFK